MRPLSLDELEYLLAAYKSTHTRTKSFGSNNYCYATLLDLGLIQVRDVSELGNRTTPKGDMVVLASLRATSILGHDDFDHFQNTIETSEDGIEGFLSHFHLDLCELFETGSAEFGGDKVNYKISITVRKA